MQRTWKRIALSRVRAAHDLMLTDMLAPSIFSGGAHPWPTELLKVLQGSSKVTPWSRELLQSTNDKKQELNKHK
eukprot:1748251-Karenia_brevis.AAC.1